MNFITFEPLYQERVWGGAALAELPDRTPPPGRLTGESWEVSDRPEACSAVSAGPERGRSLRWLRENRAREILGPRYPPEQPFPILVKWLDCRQRLSLQVHPPEAVARRLGGEPKTENWFVAHAAPGAALLAGLKEGATRAQFEKAIRENTLEELVHRFPVRAGDSFFVPAGRVHAIDAGCLILEIQQNSDTTYRVYDWGRKGLDEKPRALHVKESLACIDFSDFEPAALRPGRAETVLAECPFFRVTQKPFEAGGPALVFEPGEQPRLLHVTEGRLRESRTGGLLNRGGTALLPFAGKFHFKPESAGLALVTDRFAS